MPTWCCVVPILTWGATKAEALARLPGDELLEDAEGISTRAIGIHAPAEAVWPWLVRWVLRRAAAPTPTTGSRTCSGSNMHSVDRVLPEFQNPRGETIGFGSNRMRLELIQPQRVLAWRSQDGNWVWTFVLNEHDGMTRLISRNRFRLPSLLARIGMLPMEPGSLVMERKMLLGIKQRAETLAGEPVEPKTNCEDQPAAACPLAFSASLEARRAR